MALLILGPNGGRSCDYHVIIQLEEFHIQINQLE